MEPVFVVAKKEFSENMSSMRFMVLFGIFVVMLLLAAYQGAQAYQTELKSYNDMMTGYQGSGYSVKVDMPKPSILTAFNYLISGASVAIIGAIIGIVVGFDAVSGERERGTLKFLLTQPLFRDTLINGKFLGFISLIFVVVLTSLIICIGVIGSATGVFPDGDDLLRVMLFGLITFLYMLAFVVIGMFFSIFLKESVNALLAAIAIFIVVNLLISPIASAVASFVAPIPSYTFGMHGTAMQQAYQNNYNLQQQISYLSPSENFRNINEVILNPYFENRENMQFGFGQRVKHTISDSLSMVWGNIIAIVVALVMFFIASYILFLRQDIS
ncbi:MAG: hypothetical protein BWK75_02310 [Candidatus Altiarchaeales archaeon A3]|nr:MAG: hypothetical protein BWK75_02310 [Candidatus Altiarchaeales archaeon A3]